MAWFLNLLLLVGLSAASVNITVSSQTGSYEVYLSDTLWFRSGSTFVRLEGKTYSTDDGSLHLSSLQTSTGIDSSGAYTKYSLSWVTTAGPWETYVKAYNHSLVFGQVSLLLCH